MFDIIKQKVEYHRVLNRFLFEKERERKKRKEKKKRSQCLYIDPFFSSISDHYIISYISSKKDFFFLYRFVFEIKMKSTLVFSIFLILFPYVLSLSEEKLQVMTTKKVENCAKRSKIGDTLYMQYTVS